MIDEKYSSAIIGFGKAGNKKHIVNIGEIDVYDFVAFQKNKLMELLLPNIPLKNFWGSRNITLLNKNGSNKKFNSQIHSNNYPNYSLIIRITAPIL